MNPSLSERIALNEQKNPARRKNVYGPSFLALKTDISKSLQDGWSMRQIWSTLKDEKKIGCSYLWFRCLVKKHIFNKAEKKPEKSIPKIIEPESNGFNFRSTIDKEDLI